MRMASVFPLAGTPTAYPVSLVVSRSGERRLEWGMWDPRHRDGVSGARLHTQ